MLASLRVANEFCVGPFVLPRSSVAPYLYILRQPGKGNGKGAGLGVLVHPPVQESIISTTHPCWRSRSQPFFPLPPHDMPGACLPMRLMARAKFAARRYARPLPLPPSCPTYRRLPARRGHVRWPLGRNRSVARRAMPLTSRPIQCGPRHPGLTTNLALLRPAGALRCRTYLISAGSRQSKKPGRGVSFKRVGYHRWPGSSPPWSPSRRVKGGRGGRVAVIAGSLLFGGKGGL